MSRKVKLTITILDAESTLSFLMIGFLTRLGYDPLPKKTRGRPGRLKFVFKRGEERDGNL
ncbi:MAG: hypothetical protein KAU24_03835 [Candidatus Aenigmarchaeota archaeon]|nr:hypothetical protein [Candidatus Aenigmarchaeota archaeon]